MTVESFLLTLAADNVFFLSQLTALFEQYRERESVPAFRVAIAEGGDAVTNGTGAYRRQHWIHLERTMTGALEEA